MRSLALLIAMIFLVAKPTSRHRSVDHGSPRAESGLRRTSTSNPPVHWRLGAILVVLGALAGFSYVLTDPGPPHAVTSTNNGTKVAGVRASSIEVTSSTRQRLNATIVTEAHLGPHPRNTYAIEIQSPADSLLFDCNTAAECLEPKWLYFNLAKAHIKRLTARIDFASAPSPATLYYGGPRKKSLRVLAAKSSRLKVFAADGPANTEYLAIRVDEPFHISRPADVGVKQPLIRLEITPGIANSISSGSQHLIRQPVIHTLPSNALAISRIGGIAVNRYPIAALDRKIEIVDETGEAILNAGVISAISREGPLEGPPAGYSPVVSYTDQSEARRISRVETFWLTTGSLLLGGGTTVLFGSIGAGQRRHPRVATRPWSRRDASSSLRPR